MDRYDFLLTLEYDGPIQAQQVLSLLRNALSSAAQDGNLSAYNTPTGWSRPTQAELHAMNDNNVFARINFEEEDEEEDEEEEEYDEHPF